MTTTSTRAPSDPASTRSQLLRRPWFWPVAVLAALVVALLVCEALGWPFLRGPAERQLSARLMRPVELGERFSLRLLGSIRLDTDRVRIGPRNAGALPGEADLVRATDAHVSLPYGTVFGLVRGDADRPIRITALRFDRIDAALLRDASGNANWALGPPKSEPAEPMKLPQIGELVVRNGHLTLNDAQTKTELDATARTAEGSAVTASSGLRVDGKGSYDKRPFTFHAESTGVMPLVAPEGTAQAVPVTVRVDAGRSHVAFDGTATDLLSLRGLDGALSLAGPSLAAVGDAVGVTLPTTAAFVLKGRLGKGGEVWSLKNADLRVGGSHLGGSFSFDRSRPVPLLSGELVGDKLVLVDLAPAFGARTEGAPNPPPPPGRVLPEREFDVPSLHAMNADVKVRVKRAELGALFSQPLEPLQGDLTLQSGVLKVSNLLARAAGGEVKGGVGIDANPQQPLWTVNLRWAGIELDRWLSPRNPVSREDAPKGGKPGYISGRLGGHADLKGRGKSTARMLGTLDGTLQAWIRNGTISHLLVEAAGIDIAQGLGLLVVGDRRLPMSCAAVRAKVDDGVVLPEVAIVDTADTTLFVSGAASLASEKLDFVMTAKPKDMSPATLRTSVLIGGTFSDPAIRVDTRKLTLQLLASAALASINPLAALIPLFDAGDKEAAGGCDQTLRKLRDADGPAGTRDARAPRPTDKAVVEAAKPAARAAPAAPKAVAETAVRAGR